MTKIFNVIEFDGPSNGQMPDPQTEGFTWNGKTFVLVAGGTGFDFACYWQEAEKGWSPDQIAVHGHKVPARKMEGSDLEYYLKQGLIQHLPEGWYWRA